MVREYAYFLRVRGGRGGCFWWNQNNEQEHTNAVARLVLPAPWTQQHYEALHPQLLLVKVLGMGWLGSVGVVQKWCSTMAMHGRRFTKTKHRRGGNTQLPLA